MSTASRDDLYELQRLLIAALLDALRQERVSPEMVAVAVRLLKDNGIKAREQRDVQENLAELAALAMPFR